MILIFAATAALFPGCTKKELTTDPVKDGTSATRQELLAGVDVTSQATLYVSTENDQGAGSAEGSPKLVDGNPDTKFLAEHTSAFYVQMSFPQPTQVAAYAITSGNDFDVRDPRNWTVTASNDNVSWVVLDRRVMEDFQSRKTVKRYDFINANAYRYYRWSITATHWDHLLQMSELRLFTVPVGSQTQSPPTKIDTFQQNNLTLVFIDNTPGGMNVQQKQGLINVFFTNYPKLMTDFNPNAAREVHFKVATDYDGVAFANAGHAFVYYGATYMSQHTSDIDVATHEITHIIENYQTGPGWVTEGIADYVRHVYGLNNAAAGWALTPPNSNSHYTKGYGDAARFFLWMEHHVKAGIVKKLHTAMHTSVYTPQFWVNETGKNVDQLWADYVSNPNI
ncbi:hypothetical protein ECE50_005220 [Chitinophaga sp. Mgbs1]|uniref:F5/8 type C domain-containing protein n=1 Tax=Chitinophaga solisilvae TaxID=1233460 RepID=A0A9Q5D9B9_9BACT|nr:hypothetical protein [Chitinophaga solisilvae]